VWDVKEGRQLFDILRGGLGLTVKNGGGSDLIAANVLGDLLEAQRLRGLRLEQGCRGGREVRVLGGLVVVSMICD
jgi:hypothetical protein